MINLVRSNDFNFQWYIIIDFLVVGRCHVAWTPSPAWWPEKGPNSCSAVRWRTLSFPHCGSVYKLPVRQGRYPLSEPGAWFLNFNSTLESFHSSVIQLNDISDYKIRWRYYRVQPISKPGWGSFPRRKFFQYPPRTRTRGVSWIRIWRPPLCRGMACPRWAWDRTLWV